MRIYGPRSAGNDLRGPCFFVLRFTRIVFSVGPPGAPSFVARRKIGEKGVPKGSKAALWNLAFIRGFGGETCVVYYEFAQMQLTRFRPVRRRAGGVRFTRLRRKAKHHLFSAISLPKALLPPDSIVLLQLRQKRWHLMNNLPDLKSEVRWFYECSCHFGQCTPRALPTAMLKPRLRGAPQGYFLR